MTHRTTTKKRTAILILVILAHAQTLSRMNRRLDDVRAQAKHIKGRLEKDKDDPEARAAAARMGRIAGGWLTDSSIKSIPSSVIKALNDTVRRLRRR